MQKANRWREMLLSLAAGQAMVPFGDNGPRIRRLSAEIWALRAARQGAPDPRALGSSGRRA